ncbi:MAG: GTPase HflX [Bdellovibrionota bacterium]
METSRLIDVSQENKVAVVVGVQLENDPSQVNDDLDELESLLETLGIRTEGRVVQKRSRLSSSHLLGKGKVEEIKEIAEEAHVGLIVFDHPLTGPQVRNLEKLIGRQVLDRSGVILDIFAKHAKTNQAKTQVEIAQLEYLLPRLSGAWTHFQRQAGGGVRARGMGEKQIEIDRRRARERIARLQKRLEGIRKERETQRKARRNEINVAIVGYTNSGKTTIMSGLTRATTEGKDELFATLDANIRTIDPTTRPKILLTDTVGFIRNLPHSLVDSFKSTLEEVVEADLLLHVVDVSHPNYLAQMETTEQVLKEIGGGEIPVILVFNKIDLVNEQFLTRILQKNYPGSITVSAYNLKDMVALKKHLFEYFESKFRQVDLIVTANDRNTLSQIYNTCIVIAADYETEGQVHFKVRAANHTLAKLAKFIIPDAVIVH